MYDLNVLAVNAALVKGIQLCGAARRMVGKGHSGYEEIMDVEREIREAAAECQRVIELAIADADRPVVGGCSGSGCV